MTTWAKARTNGEAPHSGDESATKKKTVKRRGPEEKEELVLILSSI